MPDRDIEIIVVPYDVERGDTPGARGAPELARRLLGAAEHRGPVVHVTDIPVRRPGAGKAAVVAEIGRNVARAVALAHSQRRYPLIVSGGCLVAVGVVTGLQRTGRELRVVWIDAHGDFNTPESTPSGYWDGMALAAVCGRSLPEVYKSVELRPIHFRNVTHLAGRCFDPPEVEDFKRLNIAVIPPERVGSEDCLRLLTDGAEGGGAANRDLYLHIDLDGLDPSDAPAVSYPCPGGPPLQAVLACVAALKQPAAMTLSTASFAAADEAQADRTVDTCRRLIDAALERR